MNEYGGYVNSGRLEAPLYHRARMTSVAPNPRPAFRLSAVSEREELNIKSRIRAIYLLCSPKMQLDIQEELGQRRMMTTDPFALYLQRPQKGARGPGSAQGFTVISMSPMLPRSPFS